jgi:hypothetical protein
MKIAHKGPSCPLHIRGRVSKHITNGSKTAVIDVIGFLCVSLGSSTVQLHDSIRSRRTCLCLEAGFSSQNGDRAWGVYYWTAAFCCAFFCEEKGLNSKDIHKEMFPIYGGKCLSRKAVHNWVANVSLTTKRLKRRCEEVAGTTVKRLLGCRFRRTGKAMGQVYECSGMCMLGTFPPCLPTLIGQYLDVNFIGQFVVEDVGILSNCHKVFSDHFGPTLQRLKQFNVREGTRRNDVRRIRRKYFAVVSRTFR